MTITEISDSLKADGYLVIYNPFNEEQNYTLSGNGIVEQFNARTMNEAVIHARGFVNGFNKAGGIPKCRKSGCKNDCEHYGPIGGYSVQCQIHNEEQSKKRRDGYAKRKAAK